MKIDFICDKTSWINPTVLNLKEKLESHRHDIRIWHDVNQIKKGDLLFILSFSQIIKINLLKLHKNNLVAHASALPQGKGWSPFTWQILEGKNKIPLTLFEADKKVDNGQIYLQEDITFKGHELLEEIRKLVSQKTEELCLKFIFNYPQILTKAKKQQGKESFYPKRTYKDSQLDPDKTISEQFNLLRIVDNQNYPAYFYKKGIRYILSINKATDRQ